MFSRWSGEFRNAWMTESHVGPKPTFSPRVRQLSGARFATLGLWEMSPAAAIVADQTRAIRTRSPSVPRGARAAEERAALIAETKHDSPVASAAEAGPLLWSGRFDPAPRGTPWALPPWRRS